VNVEGPDASSHRATPNVENGLARDVDERALDHATRLGERHAEARRQHVLAVVLPPQRRAGADAHQPSWVRPELADRRTTIFGDPAVTLALLTSSGDPPAVRSTTSGSRAACMLRFRDWR
jgi:hypothetical protein